MRALELRVLAGIIVLAALLRFSTLDLQSLWFDEAVTVVDVLKPGLWDTMRAVALQDVTPPLYFAVAWVWTQVFGDGEVGLRSLSAVLGTATVPVAYALGARLGTRRTGLILAGLVAVSPLMLWFSQEARAYAAVVFLGAVTLLLWVRALQERTRRSLVLWAVASALALLTHYFAAFLVALECLCLLIALRGRRDVLAAVGAQGVVVAALLPMIRHQMSLGGTDWVAYTPLSRRIKELPERFLLGPPEIVGTKVVAAAVAAFVLVFAVAFLARRGGSGPRFGLEGPELRALGLVGAVGAAVLALPLALAVVGIDVFLYRYVLIAWLPLMAVVSVVLSSRRAGRAGLVAAGVAGAAFLAVAVSPVLDPSLRRENWRDLSAMLGQPSSDRVVAIGDWFEREPLIAYGHRLDWMPPRAEVSELVVVGKPELWARGWRPGTYEPREPPILDVPPPDFALVEQGRVGNLTLLRYRAEVPQVLTSESLAATNRIPPEALVFEPGP